MVIELEWSTIWSEIIRVTARDCARVRFEIKSMISDQNRQFNYHFIIAILKSQNSVSTNLMVPN